MLFLSLITPRLLEHVQKKTRVANKYTQGGVSLAFPLRDLDTQGDATTNNAKKHVPTLISGPCTLFH